MSVFYNIVVFYIEEDGKESIARIIENYPEYPSDEEVLKVLDKYDGDVARVDKVFEKIG